MNNLDLDLNLLFIFDAIYTTGNISQAAKQLDISQPAASNALSRLRKQLDDKLFVRDGNGVIPTARSEAMIGPVRQALKTIEQNLRPAENFDVETSQRHFRLIVADPLEPIIVPELLADISLESGINYELMPPQRINIEEALLKDKIDLAVFLMPGRFESIISRPLVPVDLVLIARIGHPRVKETISLDQIKAENIVALTMAPGKLENSEKLTVWHKLQQRVVLHVNKVSSIAHSVAASDVVGFVPRIYARRVAKSLKLQIIEMSTPLSNQYFHIIWHKRHETDIGHRWLRDKVIDKFACLIDESE